jgi:hypothetical protein
MLSAAYVKYRQIFKFNSIYRQKFTNNDMREHYFHCKNFLLKISYVE